MAAGGTAVAAGLAVGDTCVDCAPADLAELRKTAMTKTNATTN
jgi:hypothetical protein